jgi:NADH-quinone oxidoreductase subunit L
MTMPLMVLALLSIVGGFVGIPSVFAENAHLLSNFLNPVLGSAHSTSHEAVHLSHSTELMLMGVVVLLILIMIFFASRKFASYQPSEKEESAISKFLVNKWYVDELYEALIIKPIGHIASFFNKVVDAKIIDGFVNGVGRSVQYSARQLRLLQSGQVGSYVLIMVISLILLFIFQFFWKH